MMDKIWMHIVEVILFAKSGLDYLLLPINSIHPALGIAVLAGATYFLTKEFRKRFVTKRYKRLEKEFYEWFSLRQKALESFSEPVKGKKMAKNIDQANLNKVYYDYFFEGLLNNLLTTYIPILCIAGYINEAYKPENLLQLNGQGAVLILPGTSGLQLGGLAWYVLCLLAFWLGSCLLRRTLGKLKKKDIIPQSPASFIHKEAHDDLSN